MAHVGLELDRRRMRPPTADKVAGLEVTPAELDQNPASAPQVFPGVEKETLVINGNRPYLEQPREHGRFSQTQRLKRKRKLWLLLTILVVVIVIVIAVPLGIRRARHGSTDTEVSDPPAASDPQLPSAVGAFNGTSLTTFNLDVNSLPVVHLFYQDNQGQIRRLQKLLTRKVGQLWSGGPDFPAIVTTDVKNGTPLACVNYTNPDSDVNTAHVFYVDSSNTLQEVISTDNLSTWRNGPLGQSAIKTSSSSIALAAMYSERWFGKARGSSPGLRLYYGSTDDQVHELAFVLGDTSWSSQFQFNNSNGNAGISISSVDNATGSAGLFAFDIAGELAAWNLNPTIKAEASSLVYGNWSQESQYASVQAYPNSSLGYAQGWLSFQQANKQINAIKVMPWGRLMNVGNAIPYNGQPGCAVTAASVWLGPSAQYPTSFDIFYQPNGSAITELMNTNFQYTPTDLPV